MDNVCLNTELNLFLQKYKEKNNKLKIILNENFHKNYDLKIEYISKEIKNFNVNFIRTDDDIKNIYLNSVFNFLLKKLKKQIKNKIIVIENITYYGYNKQLLIKYYEIDLCVKLELINNF